MVIGKGSKTSYYEIQYMSVVYQFILPTTSALLFTDFYKSDTYQYVLNEASSTRSLVRDSLKRAKRADNQDVLAVIKAIEDYLPSLFSILDNERFQGDEKIFYSIGAITPSWRMPLRASQSQISMLEAPKVTLQSLEGEKGMVLMTYAMAYMLQADKVISHPVTRDPTNLSQNTAADQWKQATSFLLKAQSILNYLTTYPLSLSDYPLDLQTNTLNGLASIASGSTHLLILYKSFSEEMESLSKPSTSPGLLCRVAVFAAEKFGSALQMIYTSGSTSSTLKAKLNSKSIGPGKESLQTWLNSARHYCLASAQRFMAMELSEKNQIGYAIAYLNASLDSLSHMKNQRKSSSDDLVQKFKTNVEQLLQKYTAENNRYFFQPVPKSKEFDNNLPSGRQIMSPQGPWSPPHQQPLQNTTIQNNSRGYY